MPPAARCQTLITPGVGPRGAGQGPEESALLAGSQDSLSPLDRATCTGSNPCSVGAVVAPIPGGLRLHSQTIAKDQGHLAINAREKDGEAWSHFAEQHGLALQKEDDVETKIHHYVDQYVLCGLLYMLCSRVNGSPIDRDRRGRCADNRA